MSHFYASIQGSRGEATRQGTPASGITGHVRGWHSGVEVVGNVSDDGTDYFDVFATWGSTPRGQRVYLGTVKRTDREQLVFEPGQRIQETNGGTVVMEP